MAETKYAKAPVRIDFAGGTTDISLFTDITSGAVLNAAINKYVTGSLKVNDKLKLEYESEVPTKSGLGTSGAMNVVWLSLVTGIKNKIELAEKVYDIEQAIGIVGGKQDQYAAALGGINFLKFQGNKVIVKKINLGNKLVKKLENNLFLAYIKKDKIASQMNYAMIKNIQNKDKATIKILKNIKRIAFDMESALIKGNLDKFAELMNEEWKTRKKLHPLVTNKKIEELIKIAFENGAKGVKICGSGGGGCLLFYSEDKKKLQEKLKNKAKIINFKFDFQGLRT